MTETTMSEGLDVSTSANPVSKPTGAQTPADALGDTKRMSSLDASGQESDVKCPTCGREDFASAQGMKRHHLYAHGESIAGADVVCAECGETKTVRPSEAESHDNHFCSDSCRSRWQAGRHEGEKNPAWNGGPEVLECQACGSEYEVTPSEASGSSFCSNECYAEWMSTSAASEDLPNWQGGDDSSTCKECGEAFEHAPYRSPSFCSKDCHGDWLSKNNRGEDHPNWRGGHEKYYGPSWDRQRRRARSRDGYRCKVCGMGESQHRHENGQELHVHHIRPFRTFEGHERANKLSNLTTLCASCHRKWEGIPLRPEVIGDG